MDALLILTPGGLFHSSSYFFFLRRLTRVCETWPGGLLFMLLLVGNIYISGRLGCFTFVRYANNGSMTSVLFFFLHIFGLTGGA